jgi:elongation factor G
MVVGALVPLANMLGYALSLRSTAKGRAQYSMVFDHYEPLPDQPDDDNFPPAIGMRA